MSRSYDHGVDEVLAPIGLNWISLHGFGGSHYRRVGAGGCGLTIFPSKLSYAVDPEGAPTDREPRLGSNGFRSFPSFVLSGRSRGGGRSRNLDHAGDVRNATSGVSSSASSRLLKPLSRPGCVS